MWSEDDFLPSFALQDEFRIYGSVFWGIVMRIWKRVTALLMLLLLCLGLTGCGAFQMQMAKTTTRMAKLESFHTEAEIWLEALLTIGGQKVRMEAEVLGGFDTETDPLLIKTDLHLTTLGVERDLRYYIQKDYNTWNIYSWNEFENIDRVSVEESSAKRTRTTQALKLLIKCGESFADPVDDTVNGMPAKRYDGLFPDEYVDEALVLLDLKEAENVQESPAVTENADSETASTDVSDNEDGHVSGLPGSIWVNEDDMIVQVDVDLAVFMQKLMDEAIQKLLEEYDLDGLVLDTELKSMDARLTFSNFNAVEKLSLPE